MGATRRVKSQSNLIVVSTVTPSFYSSLPSPPPQTTHQFWINRYLHLIGLLNRLPHFLTIHVGYLLGFSANPTSPQKRTQSRPCSTCPSLFSPLTTCQHIMSRQLLILALIVLFLSCYVAAFASTGAGKSNDRSASDLFGCQRYAPPDLTVLLLCALLLVPFAYTRSILTDFDVCLSLKHLPIVLLCHTFGVVLLTSLDDLTL